MAAEILAEYRCHGGVQGFYELQSAACAGPMRFSVFRPERVAGKHAPALFFLAGLTCTEETFAIKAGAQRIAAELGMVLVAPDTSPRNTGIPGATGDWEFGEGAGFYVDASCAPWSARFQMHSFVARELPAVVVSEFGVDPGRIGICGHSMGGHGALVLGLRHPERFRSVSAFAPIVAPSQVRWGEKAFGHYLGPDPTDWAEYDACELVQKRRHPKLILCDQGIEDRFLSDQLRPEKFEAACKLGGQPLDMRHHAGYDHSYWFIQSFIEDHLRFHADQL